MASSVQRGQIWRVNLNPAQGDEMSKVRPCVVLSGASAGRLNLRLVAPVTDWKEHYAGYFWMTRIDPDEKNGLTKTSAADAFQVRSVSLARFVSYVGETADERVERIVKAVGVVYTLRQRKTFPLHCDSRGEFAMWNAEQKQRFQELRPVNGSKS